LGKIDEGSGLKAELKKKKSRYGEPLNTPVSFLNPFRVAAVCSHFCLKQRE